MKSFLAHCKTCGDIVTDVIFTGDDNEFIVPVVVAPTLRSYLLMYKKEFGCTYKENTEKSGIQAYKEGLIYQKSVELHHVEVNATLDELCQHSLGKVMCWMDF